MDFVVQALDGRLQFRHFGMVLLFPLLEGLQVALNIELDDLLPLLYLILQLLDLPALLSQCPIQILHFSLVFQMLLRTLYLQRFVF